MSVCSKLKAGTLEMNSTTAVAEVYNLFRHWL